MSVREDILAALATAMDGREAIKSVTRLRPHYMTKPPTEAPTVEIIDVGREEVVVVGGGYARYRAEVAFRGWATTGSEKERHSDIGENIQTLISRVADDCKAFIDGLNPSVVHSNLLDISYQGSEPVKLYEDGNVGFATVMASITYVEPVTAPATVAVVGSAWVDAASDLIFARLADLGANRYQRHDQAFMQLPAISIGFERSVDSDPFSGTNSLGIFSGLQFSIRVHNAYADGFADSINIQSLLNSVINQLWERRVLAANYHVWNIADVQMRSLFEESDTLGGQVTVTVATSIEHTQE